MQSLQLREALLAAAGAAFEKYQTLASREAKEFLCDEFLYRWVFIAADKITSDPTQASGSYFFLFWKNLGVTNVSYAELLSLVRTFSKDRESGKRELIDFSSTRKYKEFFRNLWESIFFYSPTTKSGAPEFPKSEIEKAIDVLLQFHEQFFLRTIIVDSYYTSVVIHIPPSISVDTRLVTIQSGYVHSSGVALYFRNIEKAEQLAIIAALKSFFELDPNKKFFITPYAAEFFSPFEHESSASIRNGLDGVRIQLRKHYVEQESLLNFLARLKELFPRNLSVPGGATDYAYERLESVNEGATKESTLWFVTDYGIVFDETQSAVHRSRDIYIVLYAQHYFNNNQLTIFKERKPAWIHSTTLPHTLSAAMVNIARHYSELKSSAATQVILDPFCGTGTTLVDAHIRFPGAAVIGLDANPVVPLLVSHNISFFENPEKLPQLLSMLKSVEAHLDRSIDQENAEREVKRIAGSLSANFSKPPNERVPEVDFEYVFAILLREFYCATGSSEISDAAVSKIADSGFSTAFMDALRDEQFPYSVKLLIYALWRALLMNTFSIRTEVRSPRALYSVFRDELRKCIREYNDFDRSRARPLLQTLGNFRTKEGAYSNEGSIGADSFSKMHFAELSPKDLRDAIDARIRPGVYVCRVEDSMSFLKGISRFADLIITDPPYGFNAFGELSGMQDLYKMLVPTLINALSSKGQLIMAVPAFAKNGKQIPYYQTRDSVVRQIVGSAEAQDRRLVRYVETIPQRNELFEAPWFWGSLSAVERRIVHFLVD